MDFDEIQRTLQEIVPEYRPMTPVPSAPHTAQSPRLDNMQRPPRHSGRVVPIPPPLPLVAALVAAHLVLLAGDPGPRRSMVE